MSTLAKLRALHEEVCGAWRKQSEPAISEGEAAIICSGFILLEGLASGQEGTANEDGDLRPIVNATLMAYRNLIYAQFDPDADIVLKGDK